VFGEVVAYGNTTGGGVVHPGVAQVIGSGSGEYSATLTLPFALVGAGDGYGPGVAPAVAKPTAAEHVSTPLAVPVKEVIVKVNAVGATIPAMFPV
jgi:hypothetical protein